MKSVFDESKDLPLSPDSDLEVGSILLRGEDEVSLPEPKSRRLSYDRVRDPFSTSSLASSLPTNVSRRRTNWGKLNFKVLDFLRGLDERPKLRFPLYFEYRENVEEPLRELDRWQILLKHNSRLVFLVRLRGLYQEANTATNVDERKIFGRGARAQSARLQLTRRLKEWRPCPWGDLNNELGVRMLLDRVYEKRDGRYVAYFHPETKDLLTHHLIGESAAHLAPGLCDALSMRDIWIFQYWGMGFLFWLFYSWY